MDYNLLLWKMSVIDLRREASPLELIVATVLNQSAHRYMQIFSP